MLDLVLTKNFLLIIKLVVLSFEIISNGKKLICNSGYFQNYKHQLNELSKSSAVHSTLILDDRSSCKFTKTKNSKY